ncbi:MAG: integrase/recombinase XerD [Planctomycetota bacterium]|jgi:integrase/recombinase XerD
MWSVCTRVAYARDLELYVLFLEEVKCPNIAKSDAKFILRFMERRRHAGDSRRTLARRQAALRSFHRFLLAEGVIREDVTAHLPTPKRAKSLPHYLTLAEMDRLLDHCQGEKSLQRRDLAIVEILYATGIRVSEMVGLDVADFQRGNKVESLKVLGKGRKERFVPVHGKAIEALEKYLSRSRPQLVKPLSPSNLFLGARGHALSRIAIYKRLRQLGQGAGIRQSVTPHLLRHTFATHLVHQGADLRSVQEMLGHANLDTTTIYTSVDAERLKKVHSRAHPRG